MLSRLFPGTLTNTYEGSWFAVWLLAPVLVIKTLMGFNFSGLNPLVDVANILRTVDGVPIDSFSPAAADAVLRSAAAWGVALLALCLAVWMILLRYRAAIPLAVFFLLFEQLARTGTASAHSLSALIAGESTLSMSAIINLSLTALLLAAFGLSLLRVRPSLQPA